MDKNEIMEKLAEISVQIFAIGKLHGISSIEKHTSDLNELIHEIANLQSWHTGTPEKEGWYLVTDGNFNYPYHPAKWTNLIGWKDCEIHPKDIVAWQEIKPHKAN